MKTLEIVTDPFSDLIQVVVSDNASTDDTASITAYFSGKDNWKIERQSENIGMAANFIHVVDSMSDGEYSWVIGDDDIPLARPMGRLLEILRSDNFDYVFARFAHMDIGRIITGDADALATLNPAQLRLCNAMDREARITWQDLIDPAINDVYLGAIMASIFRTSLWKNIDKSDLKLDGFSGLDSMYPHLAIMAKALWDKSALYHPEILLVAGDGGREWAGEGRGSFWKSKLPFIYIVVFDQILSMYEEKPRFAKAAVCRAHYARNAARYLVGYARECQKRGERFDVCAFISEYYSTPGFFFQLLKGAVAYIARQWF